VEFDIKLLSTVQKRSWNRGALNMECVQQLSSDGVRLHGGVVLPRIRRASRISWNLDLAATTTSKLGTLKEELQP